MKKIVQILIIIAIILSCSRKEDDSCLGDGMTVPHGRQMHSFRKELIDSLNYYTFIGKHDSVIVLAKPMISEAIMSRDTFSVLQIGAFLAQSYMYMDEMKPVKYYVDLFYTISDYPMPSNMLIIWNNVLGNYYLRTGLDYSKALKYYMDGLYWAEKSNNNNNIIALYANIVNIFYLQGSVNGLQYAEKAYQIAMNDTTTADYAKCAANNVMAQMSFLQKDYDMTLQYLKNSEKYAMDANAMSQYPFIRSLYAQIYNLKGDNAKAAEYHKAAIDCIEFTDPGTASQIYLVYGLFLEEEKEWNSAYKMLFKGLEVSEISGNVEYRQKIYGAIADMSYYRGDYVEASDFYKKYKIYSDSISRRREMEFYDLIFSNLQVEKDNQILAKVIECKEAEKKVAVLLFSITIIIVLTVLLILLYRRQVKLYRELVIKHQNYMSILDQKTEVAEREKDIVAEKELFLRIEDLMKCEKIYRSKTLSLESLAEKLGTNRTYCSKAINTFANMPFNKYIDRYRIEEATRIISQSEEDVLFKSLADDLGYNSVTVFSKAFHREIGCTPSFYKKEIRDYKNKQKA